MTRRTFMSRSAAAAAGLFLSSCFGERVSTTPTPRPTFGTPAPTIDTRWPIKRVVYLMLENRSFDNLFGRFPGANGTSLGVRWGQEVPLVHCPEWLPGDLPHDLQAWQTSSNGGEMDGFSIGPLGRFAYSQFDRHDVPNYYGWAERFVLCDNAFASASGPSYPNHLFFIAGQAGGAIDNPENIRTQHLDGGRAMKSWGCDAYGDGVYVLVRDGEGNLAKHSTCFGFTTMGELLSERGIDWASYSADPFQAGYIWQAYSAIDQVYGDRELWDEHIWPVDDLLRDIEAGALPSVTWITPRFQLSDHPPFSTKHAHNWVTDIVNGIMRGPMWEDVAIFITWDEWGGLYDHVPAPRIDGADLGFRVPILVISPYARRGYVDDALTEFSAPLKFIADNWDLPYPSSRIRGSHNFEHVFDFGSRPRPPDPRSKVPATNEFWDWPEDFAEWPADVEPEDPRIRYP
ncbi:MAG: alkaline phosphatase family protein [Actinomycetota bacterium]